MAAASVAAMLTGNDIMCKGSIKSSSGNRICRKLYDLLFNMHMEGSFQSEWLNCVRTILKRNGFGDIWVQQGINCDMEATRDDLKTRLQDQFRQE